MAFAIELVTVGTRIEDVEKIAGLPIDHSFLNYKKELLNYGYKVDKISLKEQTVVLKKRDERGIS